MKPENIRSQPFTHTDFSQGDQEIKRQIFFVQSENFLTKIFPPELLISL